MSMDLRAVLVDDEQLARDELGYLLGQLGGVEVIGQAGNGVEALDDHRPAAAGRRVPRRPDAGADRLRGGAPAARHAGAASHIIFVTAFDQHAIEAFEVNAVDYLLKPVDPARLELARRAGAAADRRPIARPGDGRRRRSTTQLEKIVQLVAERQSRRERLAIKVGERFLLVQAEEIIYASLADEAITVVTSQHAGTSNYRTLDELQARLDPSVFWRVHRSHLVNINKIKEIVPWFSRNYILRMKDEKATEIPVSRTQTRRLREYLKL